MSQRPPTGSSPDPIGKASARLYAAGVERQQRLVTLRFLGILLETADEDGHVHCDPDDLAGLGLLYGLEADEVARSRALLETFGVLDREPTGWRIRHFAPVGDEVPPAEVMAAISRVLAKPADAPAAAGAGGAPVVSMETARERRARRWMAAPVSAAAAAAVVLIALLVSGQMRVPLVSSPASHSQQNAVGAGSAPASSTPLPSPAGGASSAVPSASPSAGGVTAPSSGQTPSGASGPSSTSPAQAVCPVGSVSATVSRMDQHIDSAGPSTSFNLGLPPFVHTSVSGVVRNSSAEAVVVDPFPVTVNFTDPSGKVTHTATATALSAPTTIASGGSIPWSVSVQNPQDAPVPTAANAAQPTWHWDDARLASLCSH